MLCDPMDCSMPGFPVHHQLPELAQTHGHEVGDAIQPFHPLSSPSLAFSSPSIRVLSNESVFCIGWPKHQSFSFSISPFNEYSGPISFRMDWFDLFAVQGTPTTQFKSINSLALSLDSITLYLFSLSTYPQIKVNTKPSASMLLPCPGYYKLCCDEPWGARVSFICPSADE